MNLCFYPVCTGGDTGEGEVDSKLHHGETISESQTTKCTQLVDLRDPFVEM